MIFIAPPCIYQCNKRIFVFDEGEKIFENENVIFGSCLIEFTEMSENFDKGVIFITPPPPFLPLLHCRQDITKGKALIINKSTEEAKIRFHEALDFGDVGWGFYKC